MSQAATEGGLPPAAAVSNPVLAVLLTALNPAPAPTSLKDANGAIHSLSLGVGIAPGADPWVIGGIAVGITAALLYQRFYRIKLPPYLAFFGGRRFVPIITAFACVLLGVVMAFAWIPV